MAIVVDLRHVLTCAHVVNMALGKDPRAPEQPQEEIPVAFPLAMTNSTVVGRVECWKPMDGQAGDNLALIALSNPVPLDVGLAKVTADRSADRDRVIVFGIGRGGVLDPVEGVLLGGVHDSRMRIEEIACPGAFAQDALAGAAVWNMARGEVAGMISAKDFRQDKTSVYMTPAAQFPVNNPCVIEIHQSDRSESSCGQSSQD